MILLYGFNLFSLEISTLREMDTSELNDVILFISREYSVKYIDLLNTLSNYSLLPPQLKSTYSKATKYKNPAVRLLAQKYGVSSSEFNPKNKMKIINLKYQIKLFDEEKKKNLEKKYLYLVFIKKLGVSVGMDLIKNCLEK